MQCMEPQGFFPFSATGSYNPAQLTQEVGSDKVMEVVTRLLQGCMLSCFKLEGKYDLAAVTSSNICLCGYQLGYPAGMAVGLSTNPPHGLNGGYCLQPCTGNAQHSCGGEM